MSQNILGREHNLVSLIRYTLPNIMMSVFLSLYTIVDGIFVARFIGTTALSAVNIVLPMTYLILGLSIMLGTGGSAIIARQLGQKEVKRANQTLTMIVATEIIIGLVFMVMGLFLTPQLVHLLGAHNELTALSESYLRIILLFAPFAFLQGGFQSLLSVAGKPILGLYAAIGAGLTNMVLDYILMSKFSLGIAGAAIATGLGYLVSAIIGLLFFLNNKSGLHFGSISFNWSTLAESMSNGSSEMVGNIANALTTFLMNLSFSRFFGVDGIAAITIILYFQYVFSAIHFGFSLGVAPVISYNFGAQQHQQLKKLYGYSLKIVGFSSILMWGLANVGKNQIFLIFTTSDSSVYQITQSGFHLFAFAFLLMGINIFASAWFTALSDGKVSASLAFVRTLVLMSLSLLILPNLLGELGLWLAVPIAELFSLMISLRTLKRYSHKYHY